MTSGQASGIEPQGTENASKVSSAITNPVSPDFAHERTSTASIWLLRSGLVLYVCLSLWAGMVLLILPWTAAWNNMADSGYFIQHLALRSLVMNGFTRGAISGLGLVNIWMGIWEGVHYREPRT
jgi:hypothetical protein